jgi:predicted PurR-regulated permease PerM
MSNVAQNKTAANLVLIGLTAVALYLCYLLLRPFAGPILFAGVVAIVFHPLHRYSRRFLRNPNAAALASTLLALLFTAVPLGLIVTMASRELSDQYQSLTVRAGEGGILAYVIHVLEQAAGWLSRQFGLPAPDVHAVVMRRLEETSASLVRLGASLVTNVFSWVAAAVIAFVVLFFLFRDGEKGIAQASAMLPMPEDRSAELRNRISTTVVANFYGGVAVGGIQGTLTGLAFWALGLDAPLLWGLVTGLCSLVPMIGSATVWVPAGVVLLLTGHLWKGLILLAWGAGVVGLADNIVRPLIISERARLHTLYVFFALLGGIQVFGVMGLFIGPVILSVASALLGMLRQDLAARQAGTEPETELIEIHKAMK